MASTHQHHDEVLKRLNRAKGHLDKVISMIESNTPCLETAQQLQAVCSALTKAKNLYVSDHIEHCLSPDAAPDSAKTKRIITELKQISKYL